MFLFVGWEKPEYSDTPLGDRVINNIRNPHMTRKPSRWPGIEPGMRGGRRELQLWELCLGKLVCRAFPFLIGRQNSCPSITRVIWVCACVKFWPNGNLVPRARVKRQSISLGKGKASTGNDIGNLCWFKCATCRSLYRLQNSPYFGLYLTISFGWNRNIKDLVRA